MMATYGEGEPTDNAAKFYKWLKSDEVESDYLQKLKFSVFGLGNRQYEHYNKMGKDTDKFLAKFGGNRFYTYGEGDDDGSLEEDFESWKAGLWPSVLPLFHPLYATGEAPVETSDNNTKKISLSYQLMFLDKAPGSIDPSSQLNNANSSTRYYFTSVNARVTVNRELRMIDASKGQTEESIGSTRHIELDLKQSGLQYLTADNLAVLPLNDTNSVEKLARRLGYHLDKYVSLKAAEGEDADTFKHPFPNPCTVREILSSYMDIHGVPKHATLSYLLPYIVDDKQKEWLTSLLSKEHRKSFQESIEGGGKSVYQLLTNELSSAVIPLVEFLHIVPNMQPRYYTISSSSSVHPTSVHITVAVSNTKLASGKIVPGLCSTYLHDLPIGASCKIFIRPSSFRLPASLATPIIMIGPGTGIAPMRALIQEREFLAKKQQGSSGKAKVINELYFGCKKRSEDFIYQDELVAYEQSGALSKLHLAFSRDTDKKVRFSRSCMSYVLTFILLFFLFVLCLIFFAVFLFFCPIIRRVILL